MTWLAFAFAGVNLPAVSSMNQMTNGISVSCQVRPAIAYEQHSRGLLERYLKL
jgi:hypothetical protein